MVVKYNFPFATLPAEHFGSVMLYVFSLTWCNRSLLSNPTMSSSNGCSLTFFLRLLIIKIATRYEGVPYNEHRLHNTNLSAVYFMVYNSMSLSSTTLQFFYTTNQYSQPFIPNLNSSSSNMISSSSPSTHCSPSLSFILPFFHLPFSSFFSISLTHL